MVHYGEYSIADMKHHLASKGIKVRERW